MSELSFSPQQFATLEATKCASLEIVDASYGTGYPHFKGGETPRAYHNGRHTRVATQNTSIIGSAMECSREERALDEAAIGSHDLIFTGHRGIDEAESAEWLEARLRESQLFSESEIKIGSLAILGTLPIVENGLLVRQKVVELDFPSKIAEGVAKRVACGDLGQLYKLEGTLDAHFIWQELNDVPPQETPPFEGLLEFHRKQLALLEGAYRYPLKEAYKILATHKAEVIAYIEMIIRQLEAGEIHSWQQLLEQDKRFIANNT